MGVNPQKIRMLVGFPLGFLMVALAAFYMPTLSAPLAARPSSAQLALTGGGAGLLARDHRGKYKAFQGIAFLLGPSIFNGLMTMNDSGASTGFSAAIMTLYQSLPHIAVGAAVGASLRLLEERLGVSSTAR